MTDEPMIRSVDDYDWETGAGDDALRFKLLVDADRTPSHGLNFGVLEFPPGAVLAPHRHRPQEIYYVSRGRARLRLGETRREVGPGTVVYIPGYCVHGVENIGSGPVTLMWVFPTDAWSDVEYLFVDRGARS